MSHDSSRPCPTTRLNRVVVAVLRSRLHRLLSGAVMEVRYRGRRSGRQYCLPVQYARWGTVLVVFPGHAERKVWWRNLATPRPVTLVLRGRELAATGCVVGPDDDERPEALTAYRDRFPKLSVPDQAPLVVFTPFYDAH